MTPEPGPRRSTEVHAAIVDDGLWSPACDPSLRWSVPLASHNGVAANPDVITCAACRERVGLAALPGPTDETRAEVEHETEKAPHGMGSSFWCATCHAGGIWPSNFSALFPDCGPRLGLSGDSDNGRAEDADRPLRYPAYPVVADSLWRQTVRERDAALVDLTAARAAMETQRESNRTLARQVADYISVERQLRTARDAALADAAAKGAALARVEGLCDEEDSWLGTSDYTGTIPVPEIRAALSGDQDGAQP